MFNSNKTVLSFNTYTTILDIVATSTAQEIQLGVNTEYIQR